MRFPPILVIPVSLVDANVATDRVCGIQKIAPAIDEHAPQ
jgi:hypothetical protein